MGTRADFYVGRGQGAEWIGSIAWDGYPSGIDPQVLNCTGEAAYRHAVAAFLADRQDKTLPADGWPWPWETSSTTDYAYAFDVGFGGRVWGSCFGGTWFDATKEQPDSDDDAPKAEFPDMSKAKQREKFGAHSGVILIGA